MNTIVIISQYIEFNRVDKYKGMILEMVIIIQMQYGVEEMSAKCQMRWWT